MRSSHNASSLSSKVSSTDAGADVDHDGNGDECRLCGMEGTLLCCDGCPSSYHPRCIGVCKMYIPDGNWYCPECRINELRPTPIRGTSLKGAELFGVDSHGQIFMGSCDHLLVYVSCLIAFLLSILVGFSYYQKNVIYYLKV